MVGVRRVGIGIALLLLTACGQVAVKPATSPVAHETSTPSAVATPTPAQPQVLASPTPTVKPAPQPTPKVSPTLLFAVLEAKGTANAWTYNTVAIAGLDGYARAKTTFIPMPVPVMGCMGAIIPPSAHVAAGKVYFADGHGVVRSLGIDNKVTTVATFPLTSTQQMLSFAVSPDGSRIVGSVFTVPKTAFACTGSSSGSFTFDAYAVTSPTISQLVYHDSWTTPPSTVMAFTGWDALGPFGTYPTVWASQGGGPGSALGVRVRIDATTLRPGVPFSDPTNCLVWSSIQTGMFTCLKDAVAQGGNYVSTGSVRRSDGTEAWAFRLVALNAAYGAELAPDGRHVAVCCLEVSNGFEYEVLANGASPENLADGFGAEGWLDTSTMIGDPQNPLAQPPFNLAYVALNSPRVAVSLGFQGSFVGTVRP